MTKIYSISVTSNQWDSLMDAEGIENYYELLADITEHTPEWIRDTLYEVPGTEIIEPIEPSELDHTMEVVKTIIENTKIPQIVFIRTNRQHCGVLLEHEL